MDARESVPADGWWDRPRRVAGSVVLGVAFVAFVGAHHGRPVGPDLPVHRWVLHHRPRLLKGVAVAVTTSGTGVLAYAVAVLAGAAGRGPSRRLRGAVVAAVALTAGQLVRVGIAVWIGRPRPPRADWAWHASGPALPSGHTTSSALVAVLVCLAVRRLTRRRPWRAVWCAVALLWAAAVGGSCIYLGVHWASDVLAGWLLAACLALAASSWSPTKSASAIPDPLAPDVIATPTV